MWEFPGGKVEPGESHSAALTRELKEELDVAATVGGLVVRSQTEVGDSVIDLSCYWVSLSAVPAVSVDHDKIEWMALSNIVYDDWAVPDHRALDALPLLLAEERSCRG
jgi:8-oxo-dGTP diphosphatase